MESATREIFWQISRSGIFYAATAGAIIAFIVGTAGCVRFVQRGRPVPLDAVGKKGWPAALREIFSHLFLRDSPQSRRWHLMVFYGWWVLVFVTLLLMISHYVWAGLYRGVAYLAISLIADAAGACLFFGACLALRDPGTDPRPGERRPRERSAVFVSLAALCLTGFLMEGLRMRLQADPHAAWSLLGWGASVLLSPLPEGASRLLYKAVWWFHALLALAFMAWLPYSKRLRHILFLAPHRAGTPMEPKSPLPPLDTASLLKCEGPPIQPVRLGMETAADAAPRQRLGMLACMSCGRCEAVCPAFQAGQPLSPKKLLRDVREHLFREERNHDRPPAKRFLSLFPRAGESKHTEKKSIPASEGVEKRLFAVMPSKAGIPDHRKRLDSRFHGNDDRGEIPNKSTPMKKPVPSIPKRSAFSYSSPSSLGMKDAEGFSTCHKPVTDGDGFPISQKPVGGCREVRAPGAGKRADRVMDDVPTEALWACRLCRACEEACPAGIGHVAQIVDLRRAEVLHHGCLPGDAGSALRGLARTGNPYGTGPEERLAWIRQQTPRGSSQPEQGERILWPGCFPPGDEQKPRVLSCLVSLLSDAGVTFSFPPDTISCCGEPARMLGEEDLFNGQAARLLQWIREAGPEEILVHCPHCHHVLKEICARSAPAVSVVHTTEFFRRLLREKKLLPVPADPHVPVVYHDPCFLGRYHGKYAPAREILFEATGVHPLEPEHAGEKSLCCGAGGGHFFMDLDLEERPASLRMRELVRTGARTVSVSCHFCLAMFEDALKREAEPPETRLADWLELLREAVPP